MKKGLVSNSNQNTNVWVKIENLKMGTKDKKAMNSEFEIFS